MFRRTCSALSVGYKNATDHAIIPASVAAEAAVCGMGSIELPRDVNDALEDLASSGNEEFPRRCSLSKGTLVMIMSRNNSN